MWGYLREQFDRSLELQGKVEHGDTTDAHKKMRIIGNHYDSGWILRLEFRNADGYCEMSIGLSFIEDLDDGFAELERLATLLKGG